MDEVDVDLLAVSQSFVNGGEAGAVGDLEEGRVVVPLGGAWAGEGGGDEVEVDDDVTCGGVGADPAGLACCGRTAHHVERHALSPPSGGPLWGSGGRAVASGAVAAAVR